MSTKPAQAIDVAKVERQMRYLGETSARLSEIKIRLQGARHWVGRRNRAYAADELLHVINEAQKLRLHLDAWDNYMITPAQAHENADNL